MSETATKDLVVVGGGAAGYTAAIYAQRYGLHLVLLEKQSPGGQTAQAAQIDNYPGFPDGITGMELAQRFHEQAEDLGVTVQFGTAESLERDGRDWLINMPSGQIRTRTIIIATGASPRRLQVPGEREFAGKGVSYCATCDGMFYRDKDVAIVGGGNTAIHESIYLAGLCKTVYVIHRRDELRATPDLQKEIFQIDNVEFVWDTIVTEILGNDTVDALKTHNKKTNEDGELAVDGVFIAIGYEPMTDWLGGVVELEDGFVVTDQRMATNAPGIFAAGDVRTTPLRQIVTAVGDAAIAAQSAWEYVREVQ